LLGLLLRSRLLRLEVLSDIAGGAVDDILLEITRINVSLADVHLVEVDLLENVEIASWVELLEGV
jgi:hypothetical protein